MAGCYLCVAHSARRQRTIGFGVKVTSTDRKRGDVRGMIMRVTRVLMLSVAVGGYVLGSASQGPSGFTLEAFDRLQKSSPRSPRDNATTKLFRLMGKNTIWKHLDTVEMDWQTFHTQGLVKIGRTFYVSAVEVVESTVRNGTVTDALYDFSIDRSAGVGRGWLFKFDDTGNLLGQIELTDGTKYHPGGIDYDGKYIWVAVAEYRPNSKSNIFRVDPDTLEFELAFAAADHIGGIVHNVHEGTLHGVSWGSRRFTRGDLAEGVTGRMSRPQAGCQTHSSTSTIRTATIRESITCCAAALAATRPLSAASHSVDWICWICAAHVSNTRSR